MAPLQLTVDGVPVEVDDDGGTLLELLRERLRLTGPKDGCSPQGQCGCCTVLVDGQPRVACVTPARRVHGRIVTTVAGLDPEVRQRWADAFTACGASQCGFCTPGIITRLAALDDRSPVKVEQALLAHLCRCTGWNTIVEAAQLAGAPTELEEITHTRRQAASSSSAGDPDAAELEEAPRLAAWGISSSSEVRARLEGGVPQRVGGAVALGEGGFADDTAPPGAVVAVPAAAGGWAIGATLAEARRSAGKVQGRRTTLDLTWPLEPPPGDWDLTLATTWVEPAYLEPDASWCEPGGEPYTPLANGGAFGGKTTSPVPTAARQLAAELGRPVRVVLSREDVVRLGAKRPPLAVGLRADGTGVVRVVRTSGIADAIGLAAPAVTVEEVDVAGPPTSVALRGAGWLELAAAVAALRARATGNPPTVTSPQGAVAEARIVADGTVFVRVACGDPLDEVVLRSYCIGAAHQALSWVTSEGIAVDPEGVPHDLTIRSFGILRAREMPPVDVEIVPGATPAVNGSDAVLAAVAAAVWLDHGLPARWPTRVPPRRPSA